MKRPALLLSALLLAAAPAPGANRAPDWVKVTDRAGWRPRDSSGFVDVDRHVPHLPFLVFEERMWGKHTGCQIDIIVTSYLE